MFPFFYIKQYHTKPQTLQQLSEESSTTSKQNLKKTVSLPQPPKSRKSTLVENPSKL